MADSGYSNIADATTLSATALWRLNAVLDIYGGGATRPLYYMFRDNGGWSTPARVDAPIPPETGGSWTCYSPRISIHRSVNSGRDIHIVWWADYPLGESHGMAVMYNKVTLNESGEVDSVGTPFRLNTGEGWYTVAGSGYVGADAYGWVYTAFNQGVWEGGNWVYYGYVRVFNGGAWLDPELISASGGITVCDIAVNGYGDVVVVYTDASSQVHVNTRPYGGDPTDDIVSGTDVSDGLYASIAYYGGTIYGQDNDVVVVWSAGGVVRMCERIDGTWGAPEDVADSDGGQYPRVAGNLAGDVVISWQVGGGYEAPYGIMETHRYAGGSWSDAVRLDSSPQPRQSVVTARDDDGELAVAWLSGGEGAFVRAMADGVYDDQNQIDATSGSGVDID